MIGVDQQRAAQVVTAVLRDDEDLARKLIREDENSLALAWGAVALTAGIWEHWCSRMGVDPSQAWADSLLALEKRE